MFQTLGGMSTNFAKEITTHSSYSNVVLYLLVAMKPFVQ